MFEQEQTPWAIICPVHGQVFLSEKEYLRQLSKPDAKWTCYCGEVSDWDDDNYEEYYTGE